MLQVRDLAVEVGGALVVEGASFTLRAGDKVGLVGRNGAGKTSLLRTLAGESEAPAAGGFIHRTGALGYLPQEPLARDRAGHSALSHILEARGLADATVRLEKLRVAMEERPTEQAIAKFSKSEEDFRHAGGYAAESEARRIAAGLGLAPDRVDLPVAVLSGGERRSVELARILFAGSDLLLIDEPTNHLEVDAKNWLMKFLVSYRGALLVVSHDLVLLDQSITRVMHLDEGELVEYRGTYSQYREARKRDEERRARVATRQAAEIERLRALADSMRHSTEKRARKAQTLDTRVARLRAGQVAGPKRERKYRVRFPEPPHSGRVSLVVEGLAKGYGGPLVFSDVGFDLGRGERLMVIGLNGAGKTSMLRILAGETEPNAGDQQLRALLGMFGLTGERAFQDAGTLSGGEKTKLALAQLVAGRHSLLLLDEPTNNLDPPSREAVARSLAEWPGSMVIVSHDPDFVDALEPDRVLFMPEGTLDHWSEDYLDLVALA